jgi:plasmid maintenance system antidote protein VapI
MTNLNYFGQGLRAKMEERRLKVEALAANAGVHPKTIQRVLNGKVIEGGSKQSIVGALGTTVEAIMQIGKSRILNRVWVAPDRGLKGTYELLEVLDAHNLFRALSGNIRGYQLTYPTVEEVGEGDFSGWATDFQKLAKPNSF